MRQQRLLLEMNHVHRTRPNAKFFRRGTRATGVQTYCERRLHLPPLGPRVGSKPRVNAKESLYDLSWGAGSIVFRSGQTPLG